VWKADVLFLACSQELRKFADVPSVEVFFSAHGVPKSYVEEAGDPYKEEMEECVRLIMEEVTMRGAGARSRCTNVPAAQHLRDPRPWPPPNRDGA
jgi:ferrochelatase